MIYFDRIEVVNILAPNAVYDMVSYQARRVGRQFTK